MDQKPTIIYEDTVMLVVDKPPHVTVNNAETASNETLETWLVRTKNIVIDRGGIVHRLDKDTSGVLLVAKTEEALANLQAQFKDRRVHKTYLALVHGYITPKTGIIKANLGRNPKNRHKFAVLEEGRESETAWEVTDYHTLPQPYLVALTEDMNKNQKRYYVAHALHYTLVRLSPKTGRTHQIRVHLASLRHPLVSDTVYGSHRLVKLDQMWCDRQFLHAKELSCYHPITGKQMTFKAPLASDLVQALTIFERG